MDTNHNEKPSEMLQFKKSQNRNIAQKKSQFKKFAAKNQKIAQKNRKCVLILTITKMQDFLSAD